MASADATADFAEAFRVAEEEEDLCLIVTADSEVAAVETSAVVVTVALASRMATMPLPTRQLVPTLVVDAVASEVTEEEATGTVADQVVGMTRATAVAHMMIDQADIATEADTAATAVTAIAEAVPTSNLSVADESIATSTVREKTTPGSAATKATTKTRVNSDVTNSAPLSRQERLLSWWVSSVFRIPHPHLYQLLRPFFLVPFDTKGKQG